jgi:hypothetical protein
LILFGYTPGSHTGFIFWFYFTLCELRSKKNCVHNARCQLLLTDRVVVGVARAGRGEGPGAYITSRDLQHHHTASTQFY